MQLNEILEENSVKTISQKTKISESNLEALFAENFDNLLKTKALGFIAIIEREYHADLSDMREKALEYYSVHREENSYGTMHHYLDEEKKGKSKLLILIILGLLVYASWYFLTQFDKKNLSGLIPFIDEETIEKFVGSSDLNTSETVADLSIAKVTVKENDAASLQDNKESNAKKVATLVESLVEEDSVTSESNKDQENVNILQSVLITPVHKLWFGLVDSESKEREHFSIDEAFTLEVGEKTWLVATSSAPFSLLEGEKREDFNDAKEHYFKVDKSGIEQLSQSDYVAQGGWHQW